MDNNNSNNSDQFNGWVRDENGIWHRVEDSQDAATPENIPPRVSYTIPQPQPGMYQQPYQPVQPVSQSKPKLPFWLGLLIGIFCTLIIAVIVIVMISVSSSARRTNKVSDTGYSEKIDTILEYINRYYIGEEPDISTEDILAKGLLSGIGDKYAQYWTAEEYAEYMETESGEYAGIGVSVIWNDDNKCEIYKVNKNSPAKEAGLQVKDLIIGVDGQRNFEDLDAVVAVVRGDPGTEVELTIERDGEEMSVFVERRKIQTEAVEYEMLDNDIGYIYIEQFILVTDEQFNEAIDALTEQGMKSLILDLRDNPGGDYDTVVAMCDRVLPEGPIITVEDNSGVERTEYSDAETYLDIPMVCLINGNSASASEVFVGAIKDYKMATVIGETSYGKGIVQSIFTLYDGSGMKFTTERYYTPNGNSLDGVGITPDIEVKIPEEAYEDGELTDEEDVQLQKAIEVLTSQQSADAD